MSAFGEKIKKIRARKKLSQSRFGSKIGVSGKSVSAYETGRCVPPLRVLEKISQVYDSPSIYTSEQSSQTIKLMFTELKSRLDAIEKMFDEEKL